MKNSRNKGHNFEREVVTLFKNIGYDRAMTTRSFSHALDDSGIDIINTPFIIQCKAGYKNTRFVLFNEYCYTEQQLHKKFGKETAERILNNHPYIFIQKHDLVKTHRRKKHHTTVTLSLEDFLNILSGGELKLFQLL